ncbi:MAG: phosphodiester glycosidase family protein, partial [Erysipelotrichaceae bacterium]|nr:phosphodiester glycosidase family protein [Erysipelotrichaceae bacterium]
PVTEDLFHKLEERGCLKIAQGKRKTLSFHPVGRESGYLSRNETDASLRVNASFFLMDLLDLGSIYDHAMTPFGFAVKDGTVLQPPCFGREVLKAHKDGSVSVGKTDLNDLTVLIDGKEYIHGQNCHFCSRPEYKRSPKGGFDLVVSLREVAAVREGGNTEVPSSGFLIHLDHDPQLRDRHVSYHCEEDLLFAIQVGNSAVINGKKTETFLSPFYHYLRPWTVSYPPSFYPLNYRKDRAPRIVLGADQQGKPMLVWFEGAGKFGYDPKNDSAGASLSEAADICLDLGMYNGVHLDGGGSAEILFGKKRLLKVSDRNEKDFSEKERAVPLGLFIK